MHQKRCIISMKLSLEAVFRMNSKDSSSLAQQPMSVKACLYPLVDFGFQ